MARYDHDLTLLYLEVNGCTDIEQGRATLMCFIDQD